MPQNFTTMYDCTPCGERCENRWFCLHGSCVRRGAPCVVKPAQPPKAFVLPAPQLRLPWWSVGDNND